MSARRINIFFFALWTLVGLGILWIFDPINRKLDADASFMLYAGQEILRGHAPYVGVAIVKLPVSPIVAAIGIAVGRVFQWDDLVAGRIAFWLCAGLTVGAVYWVGVLLKPASVFWRTEFAQTSQVSGILLGSLAAIVLLTCQALGIQVAEGPEAKLPMICAGMFCVVFATRRQFFGAGVLGAISFMAWQPGLIFVAGAVLCSLIVPERKRAFVYALAGVAVPIILVGGYLVLNGALGSMLHQAFGANATYFQEKKQGAGFFGMILGNAAKVYGVALECSDTEMFLTRLSVIGLIGGAAVLVWRVVSQVAGQRLQVASASNLAGIMLLVSGAGLFGFSFLDLQKCSDLVPLLPFMALGAGALLFTLAYVLARVVMRGLNQAETRSMLGAGVVIVALTLGYGIHAVLVVPPQPGTLAQQRDFARQLSAELTNTDRVQQFGDAVFLVLTGRENATRYVHLGEKQGLGIFTAEDVSMDMLIAELHTANPRVITLSRAKDKNWAQPLYAWIEANYTLQSSYGATDGGTVKETDVYFSR
jgi:hypothetical protein